MRMIVKYASVFLSLLSVFFVNAASPSIHRPEIPAELKK